MDFWTGFLALDRSVEGGSGGEKYSLQFLPGCNMQCTVLQGRRNKVLEYYLLFTVHLPKNPKPILDAYDTI